MKKTIKWTRPRIREELGEFKRVAETFNLRILSLLLRFLFGKTEGLDDEAWINLENTDSWSTTTLESVFEAARQIGRDAPALLKNFQEGNQMQTPIVLALPDGRTHLVSGNTRLMICRALSERPKILKIKLA